MLKRLNVNSVIRKQNINNVGLQVGSLVKNPPFNLSRDSIINREVILKNEESLRVESLRVESVGSGYQISKSKSIEQANAIQFGSGMKNIKDHNKYSSMESSKLHKDRGTLSRETGTDIPLGKETLPFGTLPGQILKRKLLLKMLKSKQLSKNAGGGGIELTFQNFIKELGNNIGYKFKLSSVSQPVQLLIKKEFDKIKLNPTNEKIFQLSKKLISRS